MDASHPYRYTRHLQTGPESSRQESFHIVRERMMETVPEIESQLAAKRRLVTRTDERDTRVPTSGRPDTPDAVPARNLRPLSILQKSERQFAKCRQVSRSFREY